ncbi:MAG: MarR family transcriptional regulator [Clostridiales bacterium]|nr:MarR family transcriptional regulator [Clostridiales bacterium]
MDYTELAKRFLYNARQFRKCGYHKKIDRSIQGETFALLFISGRSGAILPNEISDEMNISSARVAAMLNNLEDKGLISREVDSTDRRRVLVSLTPEGREIANQHRQNSIRAIARMLESLGEHDAKEYVRIMGRLADIIPHISLDG